MCSDAEHNSPVQAHSARVAYTTTCVLTSSKGIAGNPAKGYNKGTLS